MYGEPLDDGNSIPMSNLPSDKSSILGATKAILSKFTVLRVKTTEEDARAMENNLWLVPIVAGTLIAIVASVAYMILIRLGFDNSDLIAACVVLCFFGTAAFSNIGSAVRFFTRSGNGENAATDGIGIGVGMSLISMIILFAVLVHTMNVMSIFLAPLAIGTMTAGVVVDAVGKSGKISFNGSGLGKIVISAVAAIVISLILVMIANRVVGISCPTTGLLMEAAAITLISIIIGFLTVFVAAKFGKSADMDSVRMANVFALMVTALLVIALGKAFELLM